MSGLVIELPAWLGITLNVVAWAAWSVAVGYWAHRLPLARVDHDTWLTRLRSFERGGRWYEQRLRVRAWKDVLPEAGDLFAGGFSKASLLRTDGAFLERFVAETRRAEYTHWAAMLLVPVFVVWNPWWAVAVMLGYAVVANGPCLVVQRYNRARLLRLLSRRAAA